MNLSQRSPLLSKHRRKPFQKVWVPRNSHTRKQHKKSKARLRLQLRPWLCLLLGDGSSFCILSCFVCKMGTAGGPAILMRHELSNIHQRTMVPVHSNYNPRISHVGHTCRRKGTPTEPGGHSRPCGCPSLWREVASALAAWLPG